MRGKQTTRFILILLTLLARYETISDLMQLQEQIESFQKTVFSHLRASTNNECRISSLVPLIKESGGIYRFITSMLWTMYRSSCHVLHLLFSYSFSLTGINDIEALEPLRQRYHAQHYSLRKFYSECSNLEYLTGLMNVPKLGPVRHISSSYLQTNLLLVGTTPPI